MSDSTPDMFLRQRSTNLTRCNLDTCSRASQHFYRANIGGQGYTFCSGAHITQAKANYEKNKTRLNVAPTERLMDYEQGEDFNDAT